VTKKASVGHISCLMCGFKPCKTLTTRSLFCAYPQFSIPIWTFRTCMPHWPYKHWWWIYPCDYTVTWKLENSLYTKFCGKNRKNILNQNMHTY